MDLALELRRPCLVFPQPAAREGRPVRARLPEAVAGRLIALAWWDWDHARLRAALADFRALSAEAFLEKHGG